MNSSKLTPKLFTLTVTLLVSSITWAALRGGQSELGSFSKPSSKATPAEEMAAEQAEADMEIERAKEALRSMEGYFPEDQMSEPREKKIKTLKPYLQNTESFVAGPDWEFDGFVAGGKDQRIKSMYVVNDLLYLNIGYVQGIEPGDTIRIYKKGDKVRDPQSGKFIGFEVRRAATAMVTDRVQDETCSVRILQTTEFVEIGDLVRLEE